MEAEPRPRKLVVRVLDARVFPELRRFGIGLEASTPLWYYTLKEAEVIGDGPARGGTGCEGVACGL